MKKLTKDWSYEIVDNETIIYKNINEKNIDFDNPLVLTDCYVANAFSLQMLNNLNATIKINEIDESVFKEIATTMKSAIGHPDTARVLGLEQNRINVKLEKGEVLLIVQLMGGRLPEGATKLPEGFYFKYIFIEICE